LTKQISHAKVARLKALHNAYLRLGSLSKAGAAITPPVKGTRARNMLREGAALGLFDDPLRSGPPRARDVTRIRHIYALYKNLKSSTAVAAALNPPITPIRVRQILQAGVELGLFADPLARRTVDVDEAAIRDAILEAGSIAAAAHRLRVSEHSVRSRFGRVALRAAQEAREARRRGLCIDDYRALARKIGRKPGMSIPTLGGPLYQRIWRLWGSAQAFFHEAGVTPERLGPTGKSRQKTGERKEKPAQNTEICILESR
jgi:hypothetical protein